MYDGNPGDIDFLVRVSEGSSYRESILLVGILGKRSSNFAKFMQILLKIFYRDLELVSDEKQQRFGITRFRISLCTVSPQQLSL